MKRNIIIVTVAVLAMMATSCTKENENTQGEVKQMPITITAGYEGNAKVAYTESGNSITATWEAGDQILVAYDGRVSTLSLSSGAGTDNGTFSGTLYYTHTPSANSMLSCYVKNVNNPGMVTDNGDGTIVYSDATFLSQNGSMASAASRNTYFGMATFGDGTNVRCTFGVNTSMCKFTIRDVVADATNDASLEYVSNGTTIAKATWAETDGNNLVYLAVPAGGYSGVQKLVYTCGTIENEIILSPNQATFVAGHTYSKELTLTILVTGITLNRTETTIAEGSTETLSVTNVLPAVATDKTYTWSSDNTEVATVDASTGEVTAVTFGTAHIRATANDGSGVYGECTVNVVRVITWNSSTISDMYMTANSDFLSVSRSSDGITVTVSLTSGSGYLSFGTTISSNGDYNTGGFTFTSSVGSISKIEINHTSYSYWDESHFDQGWPNNYRSNNGGTLTWSINDICPPSESVTLPVNRTGAGVRHMINGVSSIVFTLVPSE